MYNVLVHCTKYDTTVQNTKRHFLIFGRSSSTVPVRYPGPVPVFYSGIDVDVLSCCLKNEEGQKNACSTFNSLSSLSLSFFPCLFCENCSTSYSGKRQGFRSCKRSTRHPDHQTTFYCILVPSIGGNSSLEIGRLLTMCCSNTFKYCFSARTKTHRQSWQKRFGYKSFLLLLF